MAKKPAPKPEETENVEKPEETGENPPEETEEEETEETEEGEPVNLMESAPPPAKKPKKANPANIDLSEVTSELKKLNGSVEKLFEANKKPAPKQEKNLIEELGDW